MLNEVFDRAKQLRMKIDDKDHVLRHFRSLIEKYEDPANSGHIGVVIGGDLRYLPKERSTTTALLWEACVTSCINELQEDLKRLQAEFEDL